MSFSPPGRPSVVTSTLAANRLGVTHIIFFVITAAAPLTVVAGIVSTGWAVTGIKGFPLAFLIVAAVLAIFCVGYVAVARRVRNAGAFYTYIAKGLGKPFGVGGSFVAVVAYGMMQIATYGAIGPATSALLEQRAGWQVPWWLISLTAWAFVAILGLLRVDVNGRVLAVALIAEVVVVVVFDIVDLLHPYDGHISTTTLTPSSLSGGGLGIALAIAVTGYIGFEAAAVFSEESRARTVPAATYLALALMAALYAGSSWAMSVAIGPANLATAAQEHGTNLPFAIVAQHLGGSVIVDIGQFLFITSLVAAALSYHNTVARYTFALGREQVLPKFLGRTSAKTLAPKYASMAQSVVALVVIVFYAISGTDPLVKMFFWFGTSGAFGVLLLITATSVSIIGFFARHAETETLWQRIIAPFLASIGLLVIVVLIADNFAGLLGVTPTSPARWIFPMLYAVLAAAGICWALILRSTRPSVYAAIGLGAPATAVPDLTSPAIPGQYPGLPDPSATHPTTTTVRSPR